MKTIKNVTYYDRLEDAQSVLDELKAHELNGRNLENARIVSYVAGFAIQKYKSGPYWDDNAMGFLQ